MHGGGAGLTAGPDAVRAQWRALTGRRLARRSARMLTGAGWTPEHLRRVADWARLAVETPTGFGVGVAAEARADGVPVGLCSFRRLVEVSMRVAGQPGVSLAAALQWARMLAASPLSPAMINEWLDGLDCLDLVWWRAAVPDSAGPWAWAAGLTPREAAERNAAGTLSGLVCERLTERGFALVEQVGRQEKEPVRPPRVRAEPSRSGSFSVASVPAAG